MPVILLRHTAPRGAEGLCYGRSDLDLAADFEAECTRLLRDLPSVSAVVTSPLSRCRRLAEAVSAGRGLRLCVDERLVEMDFGAWEMQRWDAIERAELDAWATDFHEARPHGGESVTQLAARVAEALAEVPRRAPPVLWVTHAGVAKAAAATLGRAPGWDTRLAFGEWTDLGGADA